MIGDAVTQLGKIEALNAAATDRVDSIPPLADRDRQRRLGELIELISKAHKTASYAVD